MYLGAVCLALQALLFTGCAYYSFSGASIPSHLQSIAIPQASDNSASPLTTLDDDLTDLLVERFVRQSRLSFASGETDADALLEAQIEGYRNEPTSVAGQERATLNRVTITVSVRYYDRVNEEVLMSSSFSGSEEYDPVAEGLDGERRAAASALEDIADDVFTRATSNW